MFFVCSHAWGVFSFGLGEKASILLLLFVCTVLAISWLEGIVRGFRATVAASPLNSRTYYYFFNFSLLFLPFLLDELCMTAHREMGGLRYLSVGINSAVTMK